MWRQLIDVSEIWTLNPTASLRTAPIMVADDDGMLTEYVSGRIGVGFTCGGPLISVASLLTSIRPFLSVDKQYR